MPVFNFFLYFVSKKRKLKQKKFNHYMIILIVSSIVLVKSKLFFKNSLFIVFIVGSGQAKNYYTQPDPIHYAGTIRL